MSLRPPNLFSFCCLPTTFFRTFSTTIPLLHRPSTSNTAHKHARIPPYPYGPRHWYKQANTGLYGTTRPQYGNKVSERTEIKTRRRWLPNMRRQRLWSEALARFVRVKVHARVLRTIDKVGGLDEYLLGEKAMRIKELGMAGWALRWRLMRTEMVRERFRAQRIALGLPEEGWILAGKVGALALAQGQGVGLDGEVKGEKELKREERAFDRQLDEEERREDDDKSEGSELGFMAEKEAGAKGNREGKIVRRTF